MRITGHASRGTSHGINGSMDAIKVTLNANSLALFACSVFRYALNGTSDACNAVHPAFNGIGGVRNALCNGFIASRDAFRGTPNGNDVLRNGLGVVVSAGSVAVDAGRGIRIVDSATSTAYSGNRIVDDAGP